MTSTDELESELVEAYQDEVTSAFNYLTHAKRLEGFFGEMLAEDLEVDFNEEIGHAEEIAGVLDETFDVVVPAAADLDLARQPYLDTDGEYDASEEAVVEVLQSVATAESGAIERYSNIAELAEDAGYPDVRQLAENLLADERRHLDETESLLAQFED